MQHDGASVPVLANVDTHMRYPRRVVCTRKEYQKRLKDLEAQKIEEENAQIVQMVKAVHLDGAQLAAFLSAYASGEIALPQPDADYTDEQEETEDEA